MKLKVLYDFDTSSKATDYESVVNVDPSGEDKSDLSISRRLYLGMRNETCGCTDFYGKPCCGIVHYDENHQISRILQRIVSGRSRYRN